MPDVTPDDISNGLELTIDRIDENGAMSVDGLWFTTRRAEQLLAGERALDAIRPADLRAVIEAACGLPRGDNSTVTLGHAVARLTIALDALRPAAPGTPE